MDIPCPLAWFMAMPLFGGAPPVMVGIELKAAMATALPATGESVKKERTRVCWSGRRRGDADSLNPLTSRAATERDSDGSRSGDFEVGLD